MADGGGGEQHFFREKNDEARTFFCKKMTGQRLFLRKRLCENNHGVKTFFHESKMGFNNFLKRQI